MTDDALAGFVDRFTDEPGYLDFARLGPVGRTVREEESAMSSIIGRARFGGLAELDSQGDRVCAAVSEALGAPALRIAFQPSVNRGLVGVVSGLSGKIAVSTTDAAGLRFAVAQATATQRAFAPVWLETDHGRVTPGNLRTQLTKSTTAVALSAVDPRTGYRADLEGIRDVIGDRMLVVDATQAFGAIDADWSVADVIVAGTHTWVRAGAGTGFVAMSERALNTLVPTRAGFSAPNDDSLLIDELPEPATGVTAFGESDPDPVAQARLASALEEIATVGIPAIRDRITQNTSRIIDIADEFGLTVSSSRDESERAGIVVLSPQADQLTVLVASLHNHGVSATAEHGSVRLAPHVTSDEETFAMLRAAVVSFASAITT
jgi:selenocysteine lyase/cysteine desulfurase